MVRGRGYLTSAADIEGVALGSDARGTPIRVLDVGDVRLGPDIRRGVAELDGRGEVVGGIVIMRYGENARAVIDRVKAKLQEVQRSLPSGVTVVPTYDRSLLIDESIDTLRRTLIEEALVVSLMIIVFLFHVRSALIPILTLPIAGRGVVHPDVLPRRDLEHHVPWRYRARDRRAGGCLDCDG